jgi:hypothetical protein
MDSEMFHKSTLDYWLTNNEHFSEIVELGLNPKDARHTTINLQQIISADRHSIIITLLNKHFLEPMTRFISQIVSDSKRMLQEELNIKNAKKPMSPPPPPPQDSLANIQRPQQIVKAEEKPLQSPSLQKVNKPSFAR